MVALQAVASDADRCNRPINMAVEPLANLLSWGVAKAHEGQAAQCLDSEHFRSAPRTCGPSCGRLDVRKTERTGQSAALITHRGRKSPCLT
jgi:hypothetical protein